jgi:hypothetical protein
MPSASKWTRKNIAIIVSISIVYGIWFNYLDSAAYCPPNSNGICIAVGEILGDNTFYQPWNIIGHCIPALLLLTIFPKKSELFIASILISSAIMDSPLWGVMRLAHGLPLWHIEDGQNFVPTSIDWNGVWQWIIYYYNPIGSYPVWGDNWPEGSGLPNAALIFWSVALRVIFAVIFILWQKKQEAEGKEFSIKDIILLKKYTKKKIQ